MKISVNENMTSKKKIPIGEKVALFGSVFKKAGFSLYVVGGAVRDYLLGINNHDYDFCTDAAPEKVMSLFRSVIPTGIKHGTVTVLFKGDSYEVTTFRTESSYSDSRHPDSVRFVKSLEEDLSRRDFTVNAFAADVNTGEITDLFGGFDDLRLGIIRCIGNAEERFSEDALRLMRMARFCSKLGYVAEKSTLIAARKLSPTIGKVSKERIADELFKTLNTTKPSVGLRLMEDTGLLKEILPEVYACKEIQQIKVNCSNLLDHIYLCVDEAAKRGSSLIVRIAALLHDTGKPSVMRINEFGFMRFPGHAEAGAEISGKILKRLKCSNRIIESVRNLVRHHDVKYNSTWKTGEVKRFINSLGREYADEYFALKKADEAASTGSVNEIRDAEFRERINRALNDPLTIKDLAVNGNDLIKEGIPKDENLGKVLKELLEMVLDYPTLNKREILLEQSSEIYHNIKSDELKSPLT